MEGKHTSYLSKTGITQEKKSYWHICKHQLFIVNCDWFQQVRIFTEMIRKNQNCSSTCQNMFTKWKGITEALNCKSNMSELRKNLKLPPSVRCWEFCHGRALENDDYDFDQGDGSLKMMLYSPVRASSLVLWVEESFFLSFFSCFSPTFLSLSSFVSFVFTKSSVAF